MYEAAKWRWAITGAIFGLVIGLADILFEWRGPVFYPWDSLHGVTSNAVQFATMVTIPAVWGFLLGVLDDRKHGTPVSK